MIQTMKVHPRYNVVDVAFQELQLKVLLYLRDSGLTPAEQLCVLARLPQILEARTQQLLAEERHGMGTAKKAGAAPAGTDEAGE